MESRDEAEKAATVLRLAKEANDDEVAAAAEHLRNEVIEFKEEVRRKNIEDLRRNRVNTALLAVLVLLFLVLGYVAWTGRSASRSNGKTLSLIESVLNPDSKIRKEGLCSQLVLHNVDGPECAATRKALIDQGARLPDPAASDLP